MRRLKWLLIFIGLYQPVMAVETITFEEILQKAITNSYDLKIASRDIRLSKYALKEVNSLYFPTLNVRFNTEYITDLRDSLAGITARGSNILSDNTRFQDSVSVNLLYNLLGTVRRKRLLAKKEIERQELIYDYNLKQLKLKILEFYTEALLIYKELEAKKEILCLQQELWQLKKRLFKAGTISKIEWVNEVIRLAQVKEEVENLKIKLGVVLEDISFYTGEHYDVGIQILDFETDKEHKLQFLNIYPQSIEPEIRIYEKEIEKKEVELGILRRERFPQVQLYSNYTYYSTNRDEWEEGLKDLEPRSWVVGISIDIPLFQGLKTFSREKILKLEKEKLQLERDKKIAELKTLYAKEERAMRSYEQELETKKELLKDIQAKTEMIEVLNNQQIIDKAVVLNQKIELIIQQLEVAKTAISQLASLKKLKYISSQSP